MRWNVVVAIAKKDLLEVRRNQSASLAMLILPLILVVILPLVMGITIGSQPAQATSDPDVISFMAQMPASISQYLIGLPENQAVLVVMLGLMFAPMFLIMPLMFSSIIGAESFAGERERKTLEALLYTPTTDTELFVGKILAAAVPALLITWLSFGVYTIVLNTSTWGMMGRLWFPLPTWYPLIFWISPALSLLGVSFSVLISAKTKSFMAAYQWSGSLVVLVLGLMIGQISGLLYLSVPVSMAIGAVFWVLAVLCTWFATRLFRRTALLTNPA